MLARRSKAWRPLCALGVLALLAGCANSDFGELNQTLVTDGIHDWLGRDLLKSHPVPASTFEYTDDERALRDNAYPLIEPPYDRQKWNQVAGEYGVKRATRDGPPRIVRAPVRGMPPLVGGAVCAADRRHPQRHHAAVAVFRNGRPRDRYRHEAREEPRLRVGVGKSDRVNAARRVRENAHVVELVRWSLEDRVLAYQYVLERLVITTPMAEAVEVERLLNQLKRQIARYQPACRRPGGESRVWLSSQLGWPGSVVAARLHGAGQAGHTTGLVPGDPRLNVAGQVGHSATSEMAGTRP